MQSILFLLPPAFVPYSTIDFLKATLKALSLQKTPTLTD